jgi:hypothetical protein
MNTQAFQNDTDHTEFLRVQNRFLKKAKEGPALKSSFLRRLYVPVPQKP